MTDLVMSLERWRRDPVTFITEVLHDPETGELFELYPEEVVFLRKAFTVNGDGRLLFPELIFSGPKKLGKTAFAAMNTIYVIIVLGGRFAEGYCVANDFDHAMGRVFQAITRIIEASPMLRDSAIVTQSKITFLSTGAIIQAIPSDYAGAAGANPTITVFDELWAYTSERSHRLFDEMVPPPTRKVTCRLTVTYAGFEGESDLLEGLYKKAMKGQQVGEDLYEAPGLLCYWTHELRAPWQTPEWREQLRPNAYLRMIGNRFVSTESEFIATSWWDAAAIGQPIVADSTLQVILGIDAAIKRDSAAVVAAAWQNGKVRLINHKIFYPQKGEVLDLEGTLEDTVKAFARRFNVVAAYYDPYQFIRSAQALSNAGVRMVEYPQTLPNLTAMSSNLFELFKGGNIITYPDPDIRLAIQRAVAKETSRGMKISKEKASHKIDVVVALAMAALGVIERGHILESAGEISSLDRAVPGWDELECKYESQYFREW